MGQGQTMGQGSSMELEVNMGQGGNRVVGKARREKGKWEIDKGETICKGKLWVREKKGEWEKEKTC